MDPNTTQLQANGQGVLGATPLAPVAPVVPGTDKTIFTKPVEQATQTPAWLSDAADKSSATKIADLPVEDPLPQFRDDKPSDTDLGVNPNSEIQVEAPFQPSMQLVHKVDTEAADKMLQAGYNPVTGRKISEENSEEKTEEKEVEQKKPGFFAR